MLNTSYIVLIDDTEELSDITKVLYEKESNYEFICTSSKKTKVKEALLAVPDLIIINEDGIEEQTVDICKFIRKDKSNAITPIIVISSSRNEKHRVDILKNGVEHYIPKPLNEQFFYYTIKNLSHLINSNRCISALTGLPGNIQIENEIKRRLSLKSTMYAILYVDLDNFKAYNDKYGFMNGDEVIKFTADVMRESIQTFGKRGDFLGHIGGDDFVAIIDYENARKIGRTIVKSFDKGIKKYYTEKDIEKGSIRILNRKGKMEKYPIMTISVAMISNRYRRYISPLEIGEEGAAVKKKAKSIPGSTFLEDRRKS